MRSGFIAATQAGGIGPGKSYVDKLIAAGKTRTEAIRLLRRRLSDVAFRALVADERAANRPSEAIPESLSQAA